MTAAAPAMERTQDVVVKRKVKTRRDWAKWGLGGYFALFLVFLYIPIILMAILSFQGPYGAVDLPLPRARSASTGGRRCSTRTSRTRSRTTSARPGGSRSG